MEGLYISAMGMLSSQNYIDIHSNNIANVETDGFKFDQIVSGIFERNRALRNSGGKKTGIGWYQNKVIEPFTMVNLKQGGLKISHSGLDAAIVDNEGISFFVVSFGDQMYLTRTGHFELNENRELKTVAGAYVLDINNRTIVIPENASPVIQENGEIIDENTGETIARLQLRRIREEEKWNLEKTIGTMFLYNGNIGELPMSDAKLSPYTLESSNVDMTKEMMGLFVSQKRFQANQRAFVAYDKILEKEANGLIK